MFEKYRKKTRKEQFLDETKQTIPWKELGEVIAPYYPRPSDLGINQMVKYIYQTAHYSTINRNSNTLSAQIIDYS